MARLTWNCISQQACFVHSRKNIKGKKQGFPLTFSIPQGLLLPAFWLEREGFSESLSCAHLLCNSWIQAALESELGDMTGKIQEIHCHLGYSSGFDFPPKFACCGLLVRVPSCLLYASCPRDFYCNLVREERACSFHLSGTGATSFFFFFDLRSQFPFAGDWFEVGTAPSSSKWDCLGICLRLLGEIFFPNRVQWRNALLLSGCWMLLYKDMTFATVASDLTSLKEKIKNSAEAKLEWRPCLGVN